MKNWKNCAKCGVSIRYNSKFALSNVQNILCSTCIKKWYKYYDEKTLKWDRKKPIIDIWYDFLENKKKKEKIIFT